ncbi:hypothetical protein Ddc_02094 [Ditylenchus destructor]|nr:hypothetical protein Ddc_02094 [Ditylenchus destructor]
MGETSSDSSSSSSSSGSDSSSDSGTELDRPKISMNHDNGDTTSRKRKVMDDGGIDTAESNQNMVCANKLRRSPEDRHVFFLLPNTNFAVSVEKIFQYQLNYFYRPIIFRSFSLVAPFENTSTMVAMRRMRANFLSSMRRLVSPSNARDSAPSSSMVTSTCSSSSSNQHYINPNLCANIEKAVPIDAIASGLHSNHLAPNTHRNYLFWALPTSKSKNGMEMGKLSGSGSCESCISTPDSSRSVSFDDAATWPYIDDEVDDDSIIS